MAQFIQTINVSSLAFLVIAEEVGNEINNIDMKNINEEKSLTCQWNVL